MKVCPQCDRTFDDDSLNFCLSDGTPLVTTESQATVVIPPAVTTRPNNTIEKKRNPALLIVGIAVATILGVGLIAAVVIYAYRLGGDQARNERNGATVASPTPRSSATPKPSPSVSPSATPSDVTPTPETPANDPDEVTPIQWSTQAIGFKLDVGTVIKFECPSDGTAGTVWGSDVYTTDSSICTAAVHAGKIKLEDGGEVTIEMRPGRSTYGSTTRNDITSNAFGQYPNSFVFK